MDGQQGAPSNAGTSDEGGVSKPAAPPAESAFNTAPLQFNPNDKRGTAIAGIPDGRKAVSFQAVGEKPEDSDGGGGDARGGLRAKGRERNRGSRQLWT